MRLNLAMPFGPLRNFPGSLWSVSVAGDSALLFANTIISSALGVMYWVLAARLYGLADIGLTSAIASSAALIGVGANLGFGPILIRYLPIAGRHDRVLRIAAALIPATVALIAGTGLATLASGQALLSGLTTHTNLAMAITLALAVGTTVALVQDSIFVARRQAVLVLARGVGTVLVRLILLAPLAKWQALGLVTGLAAGALVAVALGVDAWRRLPSPAGEPTPLGQITVFGGVSYLSGMLSQSPQMLYPSLIALRVSHDAAGAFAIAWMAAALLMALPPSVANVLMTRLVQNLKDAPRQVRRATRVVIAALIPMAGLSFVFILVFGRVLIPEAAGDVLVFLPILLASVIPYAIVRLHCMALALAGRLQTLLLLNSLIAVTALVVPLMLMPRLGVLGLEVGWFLSQAIGVATAWQTRAAG